MILIVDNNIQIRSFLKQILEKLGYDIITAKNGEEAYEKIKNFPLALVLSEIQLPLLNGLQLLQKVKNKIAGKKLPCWIFITTQTADSYKNESDRLGANHFISKPYEHEYLLNIIQSQYPIS